jgi:hypothetical protein
VVKFKTKWHTTKLKARGLLSLRRTLILELENQLPLPEDTEKPFVFDENSPNLVKDFQAHPVGEKALKKLVQQVHDEFMASWEKNSSYREKVAEAWRVLYCDLPPKSLPYQNCANAAIPLALQNIVRYTNKIYTELFGDWSNVFNFLPTNPKAELIAPIVSEHSNWQPATALLALKKQQHCGVLYLCCGGRCCMPFVLRLCHPKNCHET